MHAETPSPYRAIVVASLLAVLAWPAGAQLEVGGDLLDSCSEIEPAREAEDWTTARTKARLCLEGIEQKLEGQVEQYFREEIAGWKRIDLERAKAMGFQNTTARYENAKGEIVTVSLAGGAGGGGLGGALSGLARMGMLGSGQAIRVGGLQASVTPDGQVLVPLTDGSLLTFDCPDFDTAQKALDGMGSLINDFPVKDIDRTLTRG